jgi:hypothetical protein
MVDAQQHTLCSAAYSLIPARLTRSRIQKLPASAAALTTLSRSLLHDDADALDDADSARPKAAPATSASGASGCWAAAALDSLVCVPLGMFWMSCSRKWQAPLEVNADNGNGDILKPVGATKAQSRFTTKY